jgi:hypothetical protein
MLIFFSLGGMYLMTIKLRLNANTNLATVRQAATSPRSKMARAMPPARPAQGACAPAIVDLSGKGGPASHEHNGTAPADMQCFSRRLFMCAIGTG